MENRAVAMAFLADLRDFKNDIAATQPRADRQFLETEPIRYNIFAKGTEGDLGAARAEGLDLRRSEETHLAMPAPRMGIVFNAILRNESRLFDSLFQRAARLADADCPNDSHSVSLPLDTWRVHRAVHRLPSENGAPLA